MNSEDFTTRTGTTERHLGLAKEVLYKWTSRNVPGELKYVHKSTLLIDHSYQRELNDSKRQRIASKFNWAAFGVLVAARRKDGKLYLIDGQHRLAAARSRTDIRDVPVVIFDLEDSIAAEAQDFLVTNKDRRALTGLESFRALISVGDEAALTVQRLIESINRQPGPTGAGTVACVAYLCKAATVDAAALERAWPVIAEICEGQNIDNRLVAGLVTLERRVIDSKEQRRSISDALIRQAFLAAGYLKLLRAISESAAYYKRGGEVVFARGCLNVLNYKRQNKFSLLGTKDAE